MLDSIQKNCPFAGRVGRRLASLAALGASLAAAFALASPGAAQTTTGTNAFFRSLGGTGQPAYQDGIQGFSAFNTPHGVAARGDGTILIADFNNDAVRLLHVGTNRVETYTAANVDNPVALVFDSATNLFAPNQGNSTITRYDAFGNFRQTLRPAFTGGLLTALAIDQSDNLYVAQLNGVVTRLSASGFITGTYSAPVDGRAHQFRGVAVAPDGVVYVSDAAQHVIYRYFGAGEAPELFAGTLGFAGKAQGEPGIGQLNNPHHIAVGPDNSIVVADRGNHQIRAVNCEGVISVLVGIDPSRWFNFPSPEVFPGWWDSSPEFAELREPVGVTVDTLGNLYDTEVFYHLVRRGINLNYPDCGATPPTTNAPLTAVLSPNTGIFTNGVTVTVTSANGVPFASGTAIYYTLDGSEPAPGPGALQASFNAQNGTGTIVLPGNVDLGALKVRVFFNGEGGPTVSGLPTVFEPVTVQLSPNQGFFPEGVEVRVTSASPGGFGPQVQIYYTTDATDPTQQSTPVPIINGVGVINLIGAVDLGRLRVRAFNNGVPGPVASGLAPVLPLPGLNPPSGYFITNVVITVTNAGDPSGLFPAGTRLFYTTDRSTPTQSSAEATISGGITLISLEGPINLENVRVRAFLGNTPGAVVSGEPTDNIPNRISFGFESPQEASSDFVAAPGQRFYAPVTLTIRPGQLMYGLQFALTITNLTGPASANYLQGFESMLKKPDPENPGVFIDIPPNSFISKSFFLEPIVFGTNVIIRTNVVLNFTNLLFTNVTQNLLGVGWLERRQATNLYNTLEQDLIRYSMAHDTMFHSQNLKVIPGAYSFVLPPAAADGETYEIEIIRPSANADGIREDVFIETPNDTNIPIRAVQTVTIGERRYTVGDLAPFRWFNAGDFGDGSILNNDMEQVHQTVIYGVNRPPLGSDFEGAIDSCCVDTNGVDRSVGYQPYDGNDTIINQLGFGDGRLNVADLFVSFRRALDPSLVWYERYWSNGVLRANVIPNTFRGQITGLSASSFKNTFPARESGYSKLSSTEPSSVKFTVGAVQAAPGQIAEVPVYAEVRGEHPIRTLLLNLEVSAIDGRAGITEAVEFWAHPLLGGPSLGSISTASGFAGAWLDPNHPGLSGNVQVGTLYVKIPANATANSAYLVHIKDVSASPNGIGILPSTTQDAAIIMQGRPNVGWNDGIPDAWRVEYFGTLADLDAAPDKDADGDGVNNRAEFEAGSNPKNSDDHMSVRANVNADRSMKLRFPTMAGRLYELQVSHDLNSGEWTTVRSDILGTGAEVEVSSSSAARYGYYRVRVQE